MSCRLWHRMGVGGACIHIARHGQASHTHRLLQLVCRRASANCARTSADRETTAGASRERRTLVVLNVGDDRCEIRSRGLPLLAQSQSLGQGARPSPGKAEPGSFRRAEAILANPDASRRPARLRARGGAGSRSHVPFPDLAPFSPSHLAARHRASAAGQIERLIHLLSPGDTRSDVRHICTLALAQACSVQPRIARETNRRRSACNSFCGGRRVLRSFLNHDGTRCFTFYSGSPGISSAPHVARGSDEEGCNTPTEDGPEDRRVQARRPTGGLSQEVIRRCHWGRWRGWKMI
jgi:hypothetical protein